MRFHLAAILNLRDDIIFVLKFHVVITVSFARTMLLFTREKNYKMAEELQKYKDILKREREEFERQLVREVGTLKFLLF